MLAENIQNPALAQASHRGTFFRQSGWLMLASIIGGVFMWAVHLLVKAMPPGQYSTFGVLLALVMCIPTMPLQMVFAQQTAHALATNREAELAGMIRLVWAGTALLWLLAALAALALQKTILARWEIANPAAFWITLPILLMALWMPIFWGILQGQQNFFWYGWSLLFGGMMRLAVGAVAVLALAIYATGLMTGVFLGMALTVAIGIWHTRGLWRLPSRPFDWRRLLGQVIPLMLGFGAFQFLFTADTIFVKRYFPPHLTDFYVSAGTMSRALMWLVGPLAAVMFPRIVHSVAKSEKSDLLGLVLAGTAILAITGALGLWVLGPWIVRIVAKPEFVPVASALLPWYAGAMVPLTVANVLLNNLLARSLFRIVAPLCALAIAYGLALTFFHGSLVTVLKTLGLFNLLFLALCSWFTWGVKQPTPIVKPA